MQKLLFISICTVFMFPHKLLLAQPPATATPIGIVKDSFFTNVENRIYKMGRVSTKWIYAFDLPFAVHKEDVLKMPDAEHILVIKNDTNFYYYNLVSKKIVVTTSRQLIQKFCSVPVRKIIFHKGVAGCFAVNNIEEHYSEEGNGSFSFDFTNKKNNRANLKFPEMESPISVETVQEFVQKIPFFITHKPSVATLGFTNADFEQCKKEVVAYADNKKSSFHLWNENKADRNLLLSIQDSIKNIQPGILEKLLFQNDEIYSTTSYSTGFKLINRNGETLIFNASYFSEPNTFYFPWNLYLNGYQLKGNWPELSQFLHEIYPGFLQSKDKMKILHTLVRNLYYQKQAKPSFN